MPKHAKTRHFSRKMECTGLSVGGLGRPPTLTGPGPTPQTRQNRTKPDSRYKMRGPTHAKPDYSRLFPTLFAKWVVNLEWTLHLICLPPPQHSPGRAASNPRPVAGPQTERGVAARKVEMSGHNPRQDETPVPI